MYGLWYKFYSIYSCPRPRPKMEDGKWNRYGQTGMRLRRAQSRLTYQLQSSWELQAVLSYLENAWQTMYPVSHPIEPRDFVMFSFMTCDCPLVCLWLALESSTLCYFSEKPRGSTGWDSGYTLSLTRKNYLNYKCTWSKFRSKVPDRDRARHFRTASTSKWQEGYTTAGRRTWNSSLAYTFLNFVRNLISYQTGVQNRQYERSQAMQTPSMKASNPGSSLVATSLLESILLGHG